jgi:ABC-type nitrate/sulfonate/bicarbonate transport system substrate-binding protein
MGKVSVFKLCSFICLKLKGKNKNPVLLIRKNIAYKSSISLVFTVMIILLVFPKHVFAKDKTFETIRLQLRWDNPFQFAGYYAADWNGYYRDEGLSVEMISALKSDGKILSATNEVAEGRSDFGIGAADVLIANDKGADLPNENSKGKGRKIKY